ncbi:MAG TPA: serine hydrolase [Candidatus Hydrogenedentes bacterium]|nr:serine hydrolase [Candidatus Hydrogenedentota bacterium]HPG66304.1 serine hydrolase [Candidatus Hydrogenedentota bacterium]
MKRIGVLVVIVAAGAALSSCSFGRVVYHNVSEIDDFEFMPCRELTASPEPFRFSLPGDPENALVQEKRQELNAFHERNDTTALLIIKDDVIVFENYYQGYDRSTPSMSFSTAKSILSILVGCAIDDGYLESVQEPVTRYVPELAENRYDTVTLLHLLQMTSGIAYKETDNPFGRHPRFYYGNHLERKLLRLRLKRKPGEKYEYSSGGNQLLGLVLARAIAPVTITEYMQKRLWNPLGMEFDGKWVVDQENGIEKTFCGVVACARDFAKFGRLYLHEGNWNGAPIVSRDWVSASTRVDESDGSVWNYQYQWWLVDRDSRDFTTIGHLGQYIYVSPENGVIIVRLGRSRGTLKSAEWTAYLKGLAEDMGRP